ncbi:MAG: hypothetical protein Q7R41_16100, partial [Phycisphaerales bacterium]|nr:hypothetical protein [Phycisphaerales bacterium]
NGLCGQCVNSCDVDCDGDVDYYDAGVVACAFDGFSNCCTKADGACTGANNGVGGPLCVVTTDNYCTLFTGTWHGDLTICQGDNAIDIPAASTWSLVALAISVLIASTIILRNRNPAMR